MEEVANEEARAAGMVGSTTLPRVPPTILSAVNRAGYRRRLAWRESSVVGPANTDDSDDRMLIVTVSREAGETWGIVLVLGGLMSKMPSSHLGAPLTCCRPL